MFIRWSKVIQSSFTHQKHNGTCVALRVNAAASFLYVELSSNSASAAGKNKCVRFTLNVENFLLLHVIMEKLTTSACLGVR